MSEKFDVVIIGGGPAGLSAGYFLSKYGFEVLVLERGVELGSKNVFGGRIYSYPFDKYFDGWRDEAPIERWVGSERLISLCEEGISQIEYRLSSQSRHGSFTAFLSSFTSWLGGLVESNGGLVATGVKVDDLIIESGYVSGVKAGGDEIRADYIVFAEGVNSILLEKYGFKRKPDPEGYAVGIKEVFKVGENKIDSYFGLSNGEGVAAYIMGGPLRGIRGGGFLYTMKDYVSIGIVVHLHEPLNRDVYPREIIEDLRLHNYFMGLLEDATLVEYSARSVSEAGFSGVLNRPYGNGYIVVGDSAGFVLNTGFTVRGVDYAVLSGKYAADAIKDAHEKGSRSAEDLKIYMDYIVDSPIYQGLAKFRDINKVLSSEMLYRLLPHILCRVLSSAYTTDEVPYKIYDVFKESLSREGFLPLVLLNIFNLVRKL